MPDFFGGFPHSGHGGRFVKRAWLNTCPRGGCNVETEDAEQEEEEEEEEEEEDDDDNSERAAALDAREAALIEREMALALREAEVAKREAALAEGEKALAEQRRQLSLLGAEEAPVTPTLIWEAAMAREQGKERARMEAAALRNAARADSTSRREAARQAQLGY